MLLVLICLSCVSDPDSVDEMPSSDIDLREIVYSPEPYELAIPAGFPEMTIPLDNPMTVKGVELGRMLFYDPILSVDSSQSCASCHLQASNFTDDLAVSPGVLGLTGRRSSMSLLNIGFNNNGLFWDGRVSTLEEQALHPIEDPLELNDTWENVEFKIRRSEMYQIAFREAFGIDESTHIDRSLITRAIAQFERTLISSGNAKYDRVLAGLDVFTDLELDGHDIFFDINPDISRHAECGHCHNAPLFTSNEFFNNGIDSVQTLNDFSDKGRGEVTNVVFDNGVFRAPGLRDIVETAPFMHDGRFKTLDEVIDHYVSGGHQAPNLAAVMRPLNLSPYDRSALKAFIATLKDEDFLNNPDFSNPF